MSQKRTFDKLKQPPLSEILDMLYAIKKPSPVYILGGTAHARDDYYADIQFHLERVMLLEQHGWTYEEFFMALEKRGILEQVRDFNDNMGFPAESIDRAKRFFPNAKFTQASIELE